MTQPLHLPAGTARRILQPALPSMLRGLSAWSSTRRCAATRPASG